jgi:hypothetical protein
MLFSTPFGLTTVPPEVLLRQLEAPRGRLRGGGRAAARARAGFCFQWVFSRGATT